MRSIAILAAVILSLMIVPTAIFALVTPVERSVSSPEEVAIEYIKGSPTFMFDGIASTLKVENITVNENNLREYFVTLSFDCLHGGYGDRVGKMLTQLITPHIAYVIVTDDEVTEAILDGVWDEMAQKTVIDVEKTMVEQIALNWLINAPTFKFDGVVGSAKVTDSFLAMTFAAPSFWGVTIEFDCLHGGYGNRGDQMLTQAITHHVATIHVTEGKVTLAQIDNKWDELTQKPIGIVYTSEMAEQTALAWLYACPTFIFDGVPETVKVVEVMTLRMRNTWEVTINFTCQYPGYGDRTGRVMLGHSQTHTIKITISEGQVGRAVIDDVWDEVNQVMLGNVTFVGPEEARDIAINYFVSKYGLEPAVFNIWMIQDLTPQGIVGMSRMRYNSGAWNVTVENAVVLSPVYTVTVVKDEVSLTVKVGQDGGVIDESETSQKIYTPDDARKLCLDYLMVKHPEVAVQVPLEWTENNLVEGLLGITKIQYSNGGWTVMVSGPVVWKPTYDVTVNYAGGQVAFTWKGLVPSGGLVQEISFSK